MKRLHVHVAVQDLKQSVRFYAALLASSRQCSIPTIQMDAARSAR